MSNSAGTAAVIGTGLIGRAWANVFARAGWSVRLWDPDVSARAGAAAKVADSLHELARFGLVDDPGAAAVRLVTCDTLADAVAGADLVQENGPETIEAKIETFAALDRAAPPTAILASSTSAIVASRFTESLPGRARCLVGHPVNPPHLVPIVELCGAPWTDAAVLVRARAIYTSVGQSPIDVCREIDGFILNRLQGALLAEAFRLVGEGYCSPQDLDKTLADGLGRRWSFIGPFATIELNAPGGIADYCRRYTGFYRRLQQTPATPEVWDEANWSKIVAQWPGSAEPAVITDKSRERDRRLAALAAHLRQAGAGGGHE